VRHFLAEAKRLPPFRRCIARLQRVCYMIQRVWRRQLARHRARLALYAKIWDAEVAAHYRALAKYAADLRDPGANEENEARAAALAPWRPGGVGETTKPAPGPWGSFDDVACAPKRTSKSRWPGGFVVIVGRRTLGRPRARACAIISALEASKLCQWPAPSLC